MDQIDLMRMGVMSRFPIRLRDWEIWLRPLAISETIQLAAEVAEEISRKPQFARNSITEHVIFSIKTIAMASTSKPGVCDPKITEFVLQSLTADELHFVFKEYCVGVDRINPSLEKLTQEQLDELVRVTKKNTSALIELSFKELVGLATYLLESSQRVSASGM